MTTITEHRAPNTVAPLDSPPEAGAPRAHARGERARKARLSEAHVLAAAIFRHYQANGQLESAAWSTQPVNPPPDQLPVMRRLLADFQKALILDSARALGFSAPGGPASGGPVQSRKQLTAEQLGRIATALRARMQELGIPEPEVTRDRAASRAQSRDTAPATTSDWKQLTKLIDRVGAELGWSKPHLEAFIHRQIRRRSLRGLTEAQARALIYGLEGALRHAKKGESPYAKD